MLPRAASSFGPRSRLCRILQSNIVRLYPYPEVLLAVAGKNLIFILYPAKRKKKRLLARELASSFGQLCNAERECTGIIADGRDTLTWRYLDFLNPVGRQKRTLC